LPLLRLIIQINPKRGAATFGRTTLGRTTLGGT
jgi:hypothetical protein